MDERFSLFETPLQRIKIHAIPNSGRILDIGAGGEGLVSRIEGNRVIAVDLRMSKIKEAMIYNPASTWIVCDGGRLCFRNHTLEAASLWFSLCFMNEWSEKNAVLSEIFRVLKPGGFLSVMACSIVTPSDRYLFRVEFSLPDGTVSQTGYAVQGNQNQTLDRLAQELTKVGFEVDTMQEHEHWFAVTALKPHTGTEDA